MTIKLASSESFFVQSYEQNARGKAKRINIYTYILTDYWC